MSLREYRRWRLFASTEPFLEERVDLAGALVSSVLANSNRARGSKARTISDFMLVRKGLEEEEVERRVAEDKDGSDQLKRFIVSVGGRV